MTDNAPRFIDKYRAKRNRRKAAPKGMVWLCNQAAKVLHNRELYSLEVGRPTYNGCMIVSEAYNSYGELLPGNIAIYGPKEIYARRGKARWR